MPKRRTEGV